MQTFAELGWNRVLTPRPNGRGDFLFYGLGRSLAMKNLGIIRWRSSLPLLAPITPPWEGLMHQYANYELDTVQGHPQGGWLRPVHLGGQFYLARRF